MVAYANESNLCLVSVCIIIVIFFSFKRFCSAVIITLLEKLLSWMVLFFKKKKKNTNLPFFFFFDWRAQTIITLILDQLRPSCLQRSWLPCTVDLRCRLGYIVIHNLNGACFPKVYRRRSELGENMKKSARDIIKTSMMLLENWRIVWRWMQQGVSG